MDETTRSTASPTWRLMSAADLTPVVAIADAVHAAYPEEPAIFAERRSLFAAGCLVLELDGSLLGYALAHPWRLRAPPALNTPLGALPPDADCLYLHDIALLPAARGRGAAGVALAHLERVARHHDLPALALVAIAGTRAFWSHHGFEVVDAPELAAKLASYDGEARLMRRPLS